MTQKTENDSTLVQKVVSKIKTDLTSNDSTLLRDVFKNVPKESLVTYLKGDVVNSKIGYMLIDQATKQTVEDFKHDKTTDFEELILTIDEDVLSEFQL